MSKSKAQNNLARRALKIVRDAINSLMSLISELFENVTSSSD